jgi:nucleoside-diphosphate-sugar epimerase
MKILLTGAFGNIGKSTLLGLIAQNHKVRCFDIKTKRNVKVARPFLDRVEIFWGDLRNRDQVDEAVRDIDAVIHLAFVIPKLSATGVGSEDKPDWARAVNVGGTKNLIEALKTQPQHPRIVFASSIHVYGNTQHMPPPRTPDEPVNPVEHYARHKVECERMVRDSGLEWSILRFAAAPPYSVNMDPAMFDVPLNNRIECVHTRDVGTAAANAVGSSEVWGKILMIGGGPKCQIYYRDMVRILLGTMGVRNLPDSAFCTKAFAVDWMDTRESQRLLKYQQRDLADFADELKDLLGLRRLAVRLFEPFVRRWLLNKSPYYRRAVSRERYWKDRVAVITSAASPAGTAVARRLSASGLKTILIDRNAVSVQQLASDIQDAGGKAFVLAADLSRETDRESVIAEVTRSFSKIDVLIHTTNTMEHAYSWKEEMETIQKNMLAMLHLNHLFDSEQSNKHPGRLIIVEQADFSTKKRTALLKAVKAFSNTYISSLFRIWRKRGFLVTRITTLPLFELNRDGDSISALLPANPGVTPEKVADSIWQVLVKPKQSVHVPSLFALYAWAGCGFFRLLNHLVNAFKPRAFKPVP